MPAGAPSQPQVDEITNVLSNADVDHLCGLMVRARLSIVWPGRDWSTHPPVGVTQARLLAAILDMVTQLGG